MCTISGLALGSKILGSAILSTKLPGVNVYLSMLICQLDTAADDGAAKPLGQDLTLSRHCPLHRVAGQNKTDKIQKIGPFW